MYYYSCPLTHGILSHEDPKKYVKILLGTEADVGQT